MMNILTLQNKAAELCKLTGRRHGIEVDLMPDGTVAEYKLSWQSPFNTLDWEFEYKDTAEDMAAFMDAKIQELKPIEGMFADTNQALNDLTIRP